jgi:NAD+ kinase
MFAPLHFMASPKPVAQRALTELVERYGQADLADAACVVAVGGDGTTLKALHAVLAAPSIPVFSMRTPGSVGALGNALFLSSLLERLSTCRRIAIRPLQFEARATDGEIASGIAVNEIAIIRRRFQAVRMRVHIGSETADLFGDGLVVASPIGSSGYCRSLGGPRVPLGADMMVLAGIAIRAPADGYRIVVSGDTVVRIEIADPVFRPLRIETHTAVVRDVSELIVRSCRGLAVTLLLEPGNDTIPMGSAPLVTLAGMTPRTHDAE